MTTKKLYALLETDVEILGFRKTLTGKQEVRLRIDDKDYWYRVGDKAVVRLEGEFVRNPA